MDNYPKVDLYTIHVPKQVIELDGVQIDLNDLREALEVVEDSDGALGRALIPKRIGDVLVKYDAAFENVRGSYGRGDHFDQFVNYLRSITDEI